MQARLTHAIFDLPYRQEVRAAAGDEYLRAMTRQCLDAVEALVARDVAAGTGDAELVRELHRLAGGTAAVGLCALAATLRQLEALHRDGGDAARARALWDRCRADAQSCREALASGESCGSRR